MNNNDFETLKKVIRPGWVNRLMKWVHYLALGALVIQILKANSGVDINQIGMGMWIILSYFSLSVAERLEEALVRVMDIAQNTVQELQNENVALKNSYNNVVETLDHIDKKVLAKHGMFIEIKKPEKLKN